MKEISDSLDVSNVFKSKEPVAVFLYMEGCPHCVRMEDPWQQLESENKMDFYKIESDHVPQDLNISSFPHFLMIRNGKITKSVPGEMSKPELKRKLFQMRGGRSLRFRSRARKSHRTLRNKM